MRILHLTNHVLEAGNGIVNVAVDLACTQCAQGHEVYFASSGGGYEQLLEEYGVIHYRIAMGKSLTGVPRMLFSFLNIIKLTHPDVVHAHMMTGALLAKVCQLLVRFKLITHIHNEFQKSARLMGVGDAVIAVSDAVRQSMLNRGISSKKLFVIRNGTIHSPRVAKVEPKALQHPALVTVAGLYERKGIRDLIHAFSMLPDEVVAHLYIVGEGPDRNIFENLAHESPRHQYIHFEGFQRQPQCYYQEADIFVLASRKEPFGLVLIEAREYGCAIVATDVDGIPEALENGKAGFLVPVRNPEALSERLFFLLKNDLLSTEIAIRAQKNLDDFTVERMAGKVLGLYDHVVDRK